MKKLIVFLSLLTIFSSSFSVFARDYYVCLGSFKKQQNAKEFSEKLSAAEIENFIYETKASDGIILYRVVSKNGFANIVEARKYRDYIQALPSAKKMKLSGLWPVQVESAKEKFEEIKHESEFESLLKEPAAVPGIKVEESQNLLNMPLKSKKKSEEEINFVEKIQKEKAQPEPESEEVSQIKKTEVISESSLIEETESEIIAELEFEPDSALETEEVPLIEEAEAIFELDAVEDVEPESEEVSQIEESELDPETVEEAELEVIPEPEFEPDTETEFELEQESESESEEVSLIEESELDPEIVEETEPEFIEETEFESETIEETDSESVFVPENIELPFDLEGEEVFSVEPLIPKAPAEVKENEIIIKNSDTGLPVKNTTVYFNDTDVYVTDENGSVILNSDIPDGSYQIKTEHPSYVTTTTTIIIEDSSIGSAQMISMPVKVDYQRIKIILDWDAAPKDLDARLFCGNEAVSFKNRKTEKMSLDRDEKMDGGLKQSQS